MIYKYLLEIKYRIFFSFISWSFMVFNCYYFKETVLYTFIKPSLYNNNYDLFYFLTTNITEVFMTYIYLSYFIANQILSIFVCYQIFAFISNGLYTFEYKYFKTFLITVITGWGILIIILHNFVFPTSWDFFFKYQKFLFFQSLTFYFEAKLCEYLIFYKSIYHLCTITYQIIILFWVLLDLFKTNMLVIKSFRKTFYFIFFLFATFVTPPEVFYQLIISICIIIVYELIIMYIILKTEFSIFR